MSQQQQPQRPVTYGDVFIDVEGELAQKPVAPRDAAMMQTAENAMLGQTLSGGAAAAMQGAAARNERGGFVGHDQMDDAAVDGGVSIIETQVPGRRIIREQVAGQVVGQFSQPAPLAPTSAYEQPAMGGRDGITIGEALEAAAITAGKKPVERSDAAAIQAAEVRATGRNKIMPGGIAAAAQSAATINARTTRNEDKTKLADILTGATAKLPTDKQATRRDAEGVTGAEMRNDPMLTTHPMGVAASMVAAARLNQQKNE
ncbi:hypothetical protein Dsin_023954 [Dipteronia sinensis]|uniref:SMP domain-containing protein n=1 Tax=Dipteronia sinensis TaxID=43782 RepID=A0AAE0A4K2_9ROSI|nr:hypothetical protein Dsin_023954 [Dipteronia sinensis]